MTIQPKSLESIVEEFESTFSTPEIDLLKDALKSYLAYAIEKAEPETFESGQEMFDGGIVAGIKEYKQNLKKLIE